MKTKEQVQLELGRSLRRHRLSKSWSIEKLALETGLTYSQVGRIELGKRNATIYTVYLLTKTLEVKVSEMLDSIE